MSKKKDRKETDRKKCALLRYIGRTKLDSFESDKYGISKSFDTKLEYKRLSGESVDDHLIRTYNYLKDNLVFTDEDLYKKREERKNLKVKKQKAKKKPRTRKRIKDDFLSSWEWTKLRYKILLKFGRQCMCCGASPETGAVMCVDHIKPRHTHPELALIETNLQVLCFACNKGKGAWDQTDFRQERR